MDTVAGVAVALSRPSPAHKQARGMIRSLAIALLMLSAAAQAEGTRLDPKAPQGAIGGRIEFPGNGVAPAMRICVLPVGAAGASRCIDSPQGRTLYRIAGLVDGEYQVVARVDAAETPVGGHVEQAECALAPCEARLLTVSLAGGKDIATAHLNGFYVQRADFPALPASE
jgi:hypothetical protein